MNEPFNEPICPHEEKNIMLGDCVVLLSKDVQCPLARTIADALVLLDKAINAHKV